MSREVAMRLEMKKDLKHLDKESREMLVAITRSARDSTYFWD
jgi:hypothetical protein